MRTREQLRTFRHAQSRAAEKCSIKIKCVCGVSFPIYKMHRCLYCGEWLCRLCAEKHFGKTRAEYQAAKRKGEKKNESGLSSQAVH